MIRWPLGGARWSAAFGPGGQYPVTLAGVPLRRGSGPSVTLRRGRPRQRCCGSAGRVALAVQRIAGL